MDAAAWDEKYAKADLVWGAPPNAVVVEIVTVLHPGRALDLACGEGRNAIWLATRGWEVSAIDFSQVAIDKARTVASKSPRSVRNRIDWATGDILTTTFDGSFELIVVAYLHLPKDERRQVLRKAVDALAEAGVLIVLGHDTTNIADGVGGPQDPDILFTPEDVVADIEDEAQILAAEKRERHVEAGTAIDALVVAARPVKESAAPLDEPGLDD
ncbi:bifunctional 2-polyprenyl-6-hydroxyphenol methylase/3-demethylubiquinol 3-O-methyltransferase UbiG [Antrihabitans sp. YC2-6]|uniref:class I SAM-dependent methyltransferase n=1 Tax=Antrihabitans sp. YC2-6 TaxID=2799498 RepID=UPI0018F54931|nr:class I SAM-dependent methyltransferase [Antrihabitans sp. YC2-6]MBJ8347743.1 class I SAM-dependent methyltransferase [Antrihabitans sp. YC2-6]